MLFTTFLVSAASATDLGDITDLSGPRFRGTLEGAAGAVNYYSFTLSEARDVGLGLRQQETDADLILEDGNGVVLDSSERSGTANEWLRETLLAGTYHVRIEAQEAGVSEYVFRYGVRAANPDEVARLEEEAGQVESVLVPDPPETELETSPGQSTPGAGERANVSEGGTDFPQGASTSGRVDVGGSVTGNIGSSRDGDWFDMKLEAGKRYQIDVEGVDTNRGTLADPRLFSLANAAGNSISNTGDGNGGVGSNARLLFTPTATGTHFVWVSGSIMGTYTLSVIELGANGVSEADTDFPTTTSTSGQVEVGGSVTGTHTSVDRNYRDWFAVVLEAGKRYQIDVEGADTGRGTLSDPAGSVYAAAGINLEVIDDSSGVGNNARIIYTPTASGTYYVQAQDVSLGGGTYTLSVMEAN